MTDESATIPPGTPRRAVRGDRTSEEVFRWPEAVPDGVLRIGPDRRVLDVNARFCQMTGVVRDQAIGLSPPYPWWSSQDAHRLRERLDRLVAGEDIEFEGSILDGNGEPIPVEGRGSTVRGPDGRPREFVVSVRDLVARRAADLSRERRRRQLEALVEALAEGVLLLDAEGMVVACNPVASDVLGISRSDLLGHRLDPSRFGLRTGGEGARAPGDRDWTLFLEGGEDGARRAVMFDRPDGRRRRLSLAARPLRDVEGPELGGHVVVSISDDTERHALQEAVREERDFTTEVLAAMGDGLVVFGTDGRVLRVNDRFCELTGFAREAVLGIRPPFPWWPPEEADRMRRAFRELQAGAERPRELPIRTADGRLLLLEATPGHVRDAEGTVTARLVTLRDVTARRAAADALLESEERLRTVIGTMAEGLVVQDGQGRVTMANPAACEILGLSADQLAGRTSMDPRWRSVREDGSPFPGETHPAMVTLRTGEPGRGVLMGVDRPAGRERRWIQINSDPFGPPDDRGLPTAVIATFTDVTDLRRAQEELRRSEERYRALFGYQADAVLRLTPEGGILAASPSVWRVLRIDPNDLPGDLWGQIHPDDLPEASERLGRMAAGEVGVSFAARVRRGDGPWVWVEITGGPVYDDAGAFTEIQLSLRDVSDRIQRDRDRAALHRIAEVVAAGAPAAVVFAVIARELAAVVSADVAMVVGFQGDRGVAVGYWRDGEPPDEAPPLQTIDLTDGTTAASRVWRTGAPAVRTDAARAGGPAGLGRIPRTAMSLGIPVQVEGQVWGCLVAGVLDGELPEKTAKRMLRFADLASIAIASIAERERLHFEAETDSLTALVNRRVFNDRLAAAVRSARGEGRPLSVIALDVDGFKEINDVHGHPVGDRVLQEVAERIRPIARAEDTVARIGGDEFAWILPDTPLDAAVARATFLCERVAGAPIGEVSRLTISAGVAELRPGDDLATLMQRVDAILYDAKRHGRNRVRHGEPGP